MKSRLFYIILVMTGMLFYGCGGINSASIDASSKPCIVLVDTIVLHNSKVINPIKPIHFISFITSDSLLADKKYTEWELLHMDKVYIEPYSLAGIFDFLSDTIGIPPRSLDSCFYNPNRTELYGVILNIRADYYEKYFRANPEFVSSPHPRYFRTPIYRLGHKYDYYKMIAAIPKEYFYRINLHQADSTNEINTQK